MVNDKLVELENYLKPVALEIQQGWLDIYGPEFCLKHLKEARLFEMSGEKPRKDRPIFLTRWLINARKEEEKTLLLLTRPEESDKKSKEKTMLENQGFR